MAKPHSHITLGVIFDNLIPGKFPLKLFEYDFQGFHRGGFPINNEGQLAAVLGAIAEQVLHEGRELRLTNPEDHMVYWIKDGRVVWDGQGTPPPPQASTTIEKCTCDDVPDWLK